MTSVRAFVSRVTRPPSVTSAYSTAPSTGPASAQVGWIIAGSGAASITGPQARASATSTTERIRPAVTSSAPVSRADTGVHAAPNTVSGRYVSHDCTATIHHEPARRTGVSMMNLTCSVSRTNSVTPPAIPIPDRTSPSRTGTVTPNSPAASPRPPSQPGFFSLERAHDRSARCAPSTSPPVCGWIAGSGRVARARPPLSRFSLIDPIGLVPVKVVAAFGHP
ncbi:hypothetical protein [Nonomuraea angiospora]|uniref:hypothetical protein n=1 Tax=Nonomuraea angiospora TaxID=46172 RepID=UPI0029BA9294|nr:hypothetical protein [Nonomuraea angiospora]MDX3103131.1 hypothetical protein [Nonomuraea angiospora]